MYLADNLPEGMEPLLNADHVVATRRTTLPGLTGRRLCVAEVDTEIGTVTIPKYVAVDGCGPVINLAIVDRQLREGGR